jgi:hypothetical protein
VPTDPLPTIADPAGGPTPVLDVEALLDQVEQEAEERECFANLSAHLTSGARRQADK